MHTYVDTCVDTYVAYVDSHVDTHVDTYVDTYVDIYVDTHIPTYTRRYIGRYIHTYICALYDSCRLPSTHLTKATTSGMKAQRSSELGTLRGLWVRLLHEFQHILQRPGNLIPEPASVLGGTRSPTSHGGTNRPVRGESVAHAVRIGTRSSKPRVVTRAPLINEEGRPRKKKLSK
jgi:hypothetical protein